MCKDMGVCLKKKSLPDDVYPQEVSHHIASSPAPFAQSTCPSPGGMPESLGTLVRLFVYGIQYTAVHAKSMFV